MDKKFQRIKKKMYYKCAFLCFRSSTDSKAIIQTQYNPAVLSVKPLLIHHLNNNSHFQKRLDVNF